MTVQSYSNKFNCLFDPTFTKVYRLFVLSFEKFEEDNVKKDHRDSFPRYYAPNLKRKDFNALIGGISFFDLPLENEEEAYKKSY